MQWLNRLRALFHKEQVEHELNDELRFHLEKQIEQNIANGMSAEEARYAALRTFGGVEQVKEECREAWGVRFIEELVQDVRYGLRQLRRNPGFTMVAVLTLALGIGANTAIFSVVEGVLLSSLPYAQPDRLVKIYETNPHIGQMPVSYLNFKDWQRDNESFERMGAFHRDSLILSSPNPAEVIEAWDVSANFFSVLGVKPLLGREFSPEADQHGGAPVVILSNRFWQRRFGGNPGVLQKAVTLDGKDYSVIGVLPRGFQFQGYADVYIPLGQGNSLLLDNRGINLGIYVVARLKPGVTMSQGQEDMRNVQRHLDEVYPETDEALGTTVVPLKQDFVGDVGRTLFMLFGAVGLVLLIACANVANLLLGRATARSHEFAIRSALGADRTRLIRQLLTESMVLALAGGGLGLLVAHLGLHPILVAVPGSLPQSQNIALNIPVLLFTLGVSLLVGILFGLAPAFRSSQTKLQESLKEGGRASTGGRHRSQKGLVIFQVAVTLVLLVAAGLMIRTIHCVWGVNPGFDARDALTFKVALSPSVAGKPSDVRVAYQQLLDRLKNIPGVRSVGLTTLIPMRNDSEIPFWTGSQPPPSFQMAPRALLYAVTSGYLAAMQIPLLRGRFFTSNDNSKSAPVVVIDDVLARRYFPGQDPVGKEIKLELRVPFQIVGVVGHVKQWGLTGDAQSPFRSQVYVPFYQISDRRMKTETAGNTVVVRTAVAPLTILPEARQAVYGAGRDQPVYDVQTMQDIVLESMAWQRFPTILLGVFAGLALLLSLVGIYGVISYSVTQRVHEIGIRMALGAERRDVIKLILGQGLVLTLIGVGIGIAGAFAVTRFLASLLYGVKPTDPLTFIAVSLILIVVALLACYIPARRATKVDPMVVLRYE